MDKSVGSVENLRVPPVFGKPGGGYVGILAKEPQVGRVKTRLCPPLTSEQACDLYRTSLDETIQRLSLLPVPLVVFYAGRRSFFEAAYPDLALESQRGDDLGERIQGAFQALFDRGAHRAVLVGSDSPDLPLSRIAVALQVLQHRDCVLVPAVDGGYTLVGQAQVNRPEMFNGIAWSTPEVLDQSRHAARAAKISYAELEPWDDVDDLASLQRLVGRSPRSATAHHALKILQSHPLCL